MKERFSILSEQEKRIITASVGFVSPRDNLALYVAVRNKRGWDIPGGHTVEGETPLQTFERELLEETGCNLVMDPIPVAILESKTNPSTGIVVYRGMCSVGPFTPTDEILERRIVSKEELINLYFGNKELLQTLLKIATHE